MKTTTNILFYPRNSRMNKKGEVPIYMRVTINGQRFDSAINRFIVPGKWSSESNAMKGSSEEARTLNTYISTLKNKVFKHINTLEIQQEAITADSLKNLILGNTEVQRFLIETFQYHNDRIKSLIGKDYAIATYKKYCYTLNKIEAYIRHSFSKRDIPLSDLNHAFITGFEFYLKTNDKLDNNSAMKYVKNLKKVVRMAVDYEWLSRDPFSRFKCTYKESNRTFLTQQELDAIRYKEISNARISQVRDIFVFACYTGLAFCDLVNLSPDDINIGIDGYHWININRHKTDTRSSIPILPPAQEIINKYKDFPVNVNRGTLLPVLSNQKMNAYLKEIADLCYVNKTLTVHMARHTFATTVTLSNGVPMESVSKMLGHTSIKTTQIYSKVVDSKISHDMQNLRNALQPQPVSVQLAV